MTASSFDIISLLIGGEETHSHCTKSKKEILLSL